MIRSRKVFAWALAVVMPAVATRAVAAQSPPASSALSLTEAVQLALKNYPGIRESQARAVAAKEGVYVARTAYLPRVDALWHVNRATSNNVFGLLFPQPVVPPVSGPVLSTHSSDSVWGSAAGVLLSWEAVDFGQRRANIDVARAGTTLADAQRALTLLDVQAAAADAYLSVLAADAAVRAAQANVDRLQVFANAVATLVRNQLRPGADESRSNAELAIARNQLSQAVQAADLSRAALANAVGAPATRVEPSEGFTAVPEALTT